MAELTPAQRDALAAALHDVRADVRERVLEYAVTSWERLGSWRDDDVARFLSVVLPQIEGGKRTVAQATDAALSAMLDDTPAGVVDLAGIRQGTTPDVVYQRPAVAMRSALAEGASMADAIEAGSRRLASLVATDLQLAHTHQARHTMTAPAGRRVGRRPRRGELVEAFRRVPSGSENCALCLIASTQRYWARDLLPIHPGCDCQVEPLGKGEHVAQVIDKDLLEAVHAQVEGLTGEGVDRSGRDVDYRELVITRKHGEYGPTIGWRAHKFTDRAALDEKGREVVAIEPPKPAPAAPKLYPVPGSKWGEMTEAEPVDWLSSSFTRRELADFAHQDLVDLLTEAQQVNDPTAWEWVNAELLKRERQGAGGYKGTGYTLSELRAQFWEATEAQYWDAERVTNGNLLNAEGIAAGINPRLLFTNAEKENHERALARAMKYASDELKWYWQESPRLTFDAFVGNADALAQANRMDGF